MFMDHGMALNALQHVMEVTWPAARVSLDNTCSFTVQILGISLGTSCSYNIQPWWDECWGGLVGAYTEPKFLLCCNWTCDVFTVSSNVMTCSVVKVCLHCRGSCCYCPLWSWMQQDHLKCQYVSSRECSITLQKTAIFISIGSVFSSSCVRW